MDTKAKKKILTIGFIALFGAMIAGGASLMPNFGVTACFPTARMATFTSQQPQDTLITPATYEQYLPLQSPADVAVSDDFTAIADGNTIYVYNRARQTYRTYTHTANTTSDLNVVANLEFSDYGDLYFIDGNAHMYTIESTLLASSTNELTTKADFPAFFCNAFVINGNDLYFAVSSEASAHLSRTNLSAPNASSADLIVSNISKGPAIAYYDDVLYYTNGNGNFLNKIALDDDAPADEICAFTVPISSLTVNGDEVFITNTNNEFYVYNRATLNGLASDIQPLDKDQSGGYKTLSSHEEYVYVIHDRSVRQYETNKGFTAFEISADSSSPHRLQGATDAILQGDKLYVADSGNSRISIYDTASGAYQTVATPSPATMVAAYGNSVLAANETTAWLIDLTNPTSLQTFKGFQGNLVGVASVYGTYYLTTATNVYYSLSYLPLPMEEENPASAPAYAWQLSDGAQKTNTISPGLLTSDVYGNLYVVAGNDVHKFTETDFLSPDAYGTEILSLLPTHPEKILVDLNENVHVLKEGKAHTYAYDPQADSYADTATETPLSASLVYGQTENTVVNAFAFDVADNATYVLYAGNLVIKTPRLLLPTVQQVATNGIEQEIFAEGSADFKVVETAENAFLIEFDLTALGGLSSRASELVFPYLSHKRETQPRTALMLGHAGEYSVLAIFDKETHTYGNYLTKTRYFVSEKAESDYLVNYPPEEEKTAYLTNALTLYKYPYLTELLKVSSLTKNQQVTLVGEINELDYSYYKIEVTGEDGVKQTGFIPKSYATLFDGSPKPSETQTYGKQSASEDSIWRLTYLLLGAAAICVLVDLLILHHRPKDE